MNLKSSEINEAEKRSIFFTNFFSSNKKVNIILLILIVITLYNIIAIYDYFFNPEIPYFDAKHIIVGGVTIIIFFAIYSYMFIYYNKLIKKLSNKKTITERFKDFSKYANDIVIIIDESGKIIEFNEKACKSFGYSDKQLKEKNIRELLTDKISNEFENLIKKIKNNDGLIFESEYVKSDGNLYYAEVNSQNVIIDNKSCFHFNIRDITFRKQIDLELIESEEKYRGFLENSNDLIWSLDKNGCFIWANKKAEDVSGYKLEEVFGKSFTPLLYKDDIKIVTDAFEKVIKGENQCFEARAIKKNNDVFCLLINSGPYKRHGEIIGTIAFAKDITQFKKTQEELESLNNYLKISEERFRSLTESSSAGIFLHNGENFEFVNETVTNSTGFTKKEMYSMKFFEIIHPDDRQMIIDFWNKRSNGENIPNKYECKLITKDGHLLWSEISAKLIELNNRKYLIGTAFNITERKNAEEMLRIANNELIKAKNKAEESDMLKTAFINNISHEIRTPMNAIIGFSELLNDENLTFDKRKQYIELINSSSNQLLSIISDIISISNIQAGKEKLRIKELNLNNTLRNLYKQFELKYKNESVQIRLKIPISDKLSEIKTDETKVTQILSNLIVNSLKFTNNGYVEFGYVIKSNWLEFYVEDTGIGIEEEAHLKIFERFTQANPSISDNYGGTGLGLSISKNFVEILGGTIWLKSKLGKGSTFYFTIPFEPVNENEVIYKESNETLKNISKTILIAEDEDANFILLSAMLAKTKCKILRACNGAEASELLKLTPEISLIIMDIKMPVMNGIDATQLIREYNKNIPIIAQTAYAQDEDKQLAFEKGCNDFLLKPIVKNDLINLIYKYL